MLLLLLCLRFGTLAGEALSANDFLDGKSINVVVRFFRNGGEGQGSGETGGASYISVPVATTTTRRRRRRGIRGRLLLLLLEEDGRGEVGTIVVTDATSKGETTTGTNNGTVALVMSALGTTRFHALHLGGNGLSSCQFSVGDRIIMTAIMTVPCGIDILDRRLARVVDIHVSKSCRETAPK
jgi:hypothetical protein